MVIQYGKKWLGFNFLVAGYLIAIISIMAALNKRMITDWIWLLWIFKFRLLKSQTKKEGRIND